MASTINASTSAGVVTSADTSGVLQLQTAGTTALTVDTSANIGIGTASPASKLDVTATIRAVSSTAVAPTSGKGVEVWYDSSGDFGRIATYDRTGAAYKNQYIDGAALYLNSQSSGNVGIGTSSPVSKLDVRGTAGITSFTGTSPMAITTQGATSTNDYSGIDFTENGNAPRARIASYFSGSGSYLQFGTSNNYTSGITNTAMTIDYSGNVGIGTSSPGGKLQVSGADSSVVTLINGATKGVRFNISSSGSAIEGVDNTGVASYQPLTLGGVSLSFSTSGTGRVNVDSNGNMLVVSAAGLGYGTGAGGTVTQATSKSTAVTLNKPTGQITTNNAALAGGASVAFQVFNSLMSASDTVVLQSTNGNYTPRVYNNTSGSFFVNLKNETGGSLSDAIIINFAIIKGATS